MISVPAHSRRAGPSMLCVGASLLTLILSAAVARCSPVGSAVSARQLPDAPPSVSTNKLDSEACVVGNHTYGAGAAVPGGRCERCTCARGRVACTPAACETRPGCKALHRPDECCPTFQCECEQDGRVYGNGEKLVDPADPCKVCYCQGGEVVCRRIACFVRSDCQPRLVPGRCCPQYDNCPLRGASTESSNSSALVTSPEDSATQKTPKQEENAQKEITIKEVTPVSELPTIVSGIRIKEVVPSVEVSAPADHVQTVPTTMTSSGTNEHLTAHTKQETPVAKQEIKKQKVESIGSTTKNPIPSTTPASATTMISATSDVHSSVASPPEEEDLPSELVNPAFPPLPDDLSEPTRDDSDLPYPHSSADPALADQQTSVSPSQNAAVELTRTAQSTNTPDALTTAVTIPETTVRSTFEPSPSTKKSEPLIPSTQVPVTLAPRAEILPIMRVKSDQVTVEINKNNASLPAFTVTSTNVPSSTTEEITVKNKIDDFDPVLLATTPSQVQETKSPVFTVALSTTEGAKVISSISTTAENSLDSVGSTSTSADSFSKPSLVTLSVSSPVQSTSNPPVGSSTSTAPETVPTTKDESTIVTVETKSITEPSRPMSSSVAPQSTPAAITEPQEQKTISPSKESPVPSTPLYSSTASSTDNIPESSTTNVDKQTESVQVLAEATAAQATERSEERSGALVATSAPANSNNALSDLIKLVGDVASIGDNTAKATDSRIEISEEDSAPASDLPPPSRAEPVTRRPIIDREPSAPPTAVSPPRDIEIINKAYVPSIRRPAPTKLLQPAPPRASPDN